MTKKNTQHITMEIPSDAEHISTVRLAISGIASRMAFSIEDIEDMKIAVSEACTNAIQHAYDTEEGRISILCCLEENFQPEFSNSIRIDFSS